MKHLALPLVALTLTAMPVAGQELRAEAQLVYDCFLSAPTGTQIPKCLGYAAGQCQALPGGQTTVGITACIASETQSWDAILNEQYRLTRAEFRNRDAAGSGIDLAGPLLEAQRAWVTFRDAECGLTYKRWGDGSIRSIAHANCVLGFTARRTLGLRDMRGAS